MENPSIVFKSEQEVGGWYYNKRVTGRIILVMELYCVLTSNVNIQVVIIYHQFLYPCFYHLYVLYYKVFNMLL